MAKKLAYGILAKYADKDLKESDAHQVIHVTSADDAEVAAKIDEASRKIFEKNREAYRILAKYADKDLKESDAHQVIHVTSADDAEVAAKIDEASRKIIVRNRKAYGILAKYADKDLIPQEEFAWERAVIEKYGKDID